MPGVRSFGLQVAGYKLQKNATFEFNDMSRRWLVCGDSRPAVSKFLVAQVIRLSF